MEFLKIIKDYILVLRPVNLLIICATQYFIQYFIIVPDVGAVTLKGNLFGLFVLDTLIIAASGYLINDIIDQQTDQVNKPSKQYIGNHISEVAGYIYYIALLIIGAMLSVYIAYHTDTWKYLWVYPFGIWSMYLYSRFFKSMVLIGNIFVSLFIAGVIGILGFAQFTKGYAISSHLRVLLMAYMVFMFLLNLIRELVKDIEDTEGDLKAGIITLPLKCGIQPTKNVIILLITSLLITLGYWLIIFRSGFSIYYNLLIIIGIMFPLIFLILKIQKAKNKDDYKQVSFLIKILLILGLISILFIT
ncbi:MAG: geranylgeranylglycerol-phosphate geranylgeranyltransferase [Chitinophagales bacterium]|nr:geranylgeranylglycerol-phosphate geranylgeranyltransferase [Chitinophagales bacterium]